MKKSKLILFLTCIIFACVAVSCSDDSEDLETQSQIEGNWVGIKSYNNPVSGKKYHYLHASFTSANTGTLTFESSEDYRVASFTYTIKDKTIYCEGYTSSTTDPTVYDFSINFRVEGNRLFASSPYSGFILTQDGSIETDLEGNILIDNSYQEEENEESGSNSNPPSQGNVDKTHTDQLLSGYEWEYSRTSYDSKHHKTGQTYIIFHFWDNNKVSLLNSKTSYSSSGFYGTTSSSYLIGVGTFKLKGNKLTCNFDQVIVDAEGEKEWMGWKDGESRVESYEIEFYDEETFKMKIFNDEIYFDVTKY